MNIAMLTDVRTKRLFGFVIPLVLLLMANVLASAQDLPTTTVNGNTCYYYDVQPRETVYGIAQKLGLSREEIVKYNPSVADGLKAGSRLYFPLAAFKGADSVARVRQAHVVKPKESVYGISKQYGMSVDRLIELNPTAAEGVKAGDRLAVEAVASGTEMPFAEMAAKGYRYYEIRPGETLYSIAMANGVTVEEILEANPGLDATNYKSGTKIGIPQHLTHQDLEPRPRFQIPSNEEEDVEAPEEGADAEDIADDGVDDAPVAPAVLAADTVRIAVLMPFMLDDEQPARTAQLYTEFFRGMMLAAEKKVSDGGLPVVISAFDTKGSAETVADLMQQPPMASMTMIIVPDDEEQVAAVAEGASDNTWVFNTFAVKDTSYVDTPRMIQANIPHKRMYRHAIEAFDDMFEGATPVFVSRIEGQADKQPFVAMLREHLDAQGRQYEDVTFRNVLSLDDLDGIRPDSTNYVFIPITGSRTEFSKLTGALKRLQERGGSASSVSLFGYPEWVTFRGDYFNDLCDLNAVIYTRFYDLEDSADSNGVQEAYLTAYGRKMFDAVPRQGVLGYDAGLYVIDAARQLAGGNALPTEFDGVQSSLSLVPVEDGGYYNDRLLIVSFKAGGKVQKRKF